MYTIRKGSSYKGDRLTIKGFKTLDAMHAFLNKQTDNKWSVNNGTGGIVDADTVAALKPGVYAYAGGKWHNVKHLDASVLAHI